MTYFRYHILCTKMVKIQCTDVGSILLFRIVYIVSLEREPEQQKLYCRFFYYFIPHPLFCQLYYSIYVYLHICYHQTPFYNDVLPLVGL